MPSCSSCGTVGSIPQFLYNQQVVQFLVGLNDAYSLVRSNILMMKPTPHINETYQLVLQDEKQRELKSSFDVGSDSTVLNAYQKSGFGSGRGSSSNVRGGQLNYRGGGRGNDRRSMYYCDNCKIPGHSIERCFKIHGYPPRNDKDRTQNPRKDQQRGSVFNANGSTARDDVQCETPNSSSNFEPVLTKEQYSKLIALLSKNEISESVPDKASMMAGMNFSLAAHISSHRWVIDTGATHHITPHLSLFENYNELTKPEYITMPDRSKREIKHVGRVLLHDNLVIEDVLHVPEFAFNLLSASHLTKTLNISLLFTSSQCFIV